MEDPRQLHWGPQRPVGRALGAQGGSDRRVEEEGLAGYKKKPTYGFSRTMTLNELAWVITRG